MKFKEDKLYSHVRKLLRQKYPQKDEQKIGEEKKCNTSKPDFVIERKIRGKIHRIVIGVKAKHEMTRNEKTDTEKKGMEAIKKEIPHRLIFP